MTKFARNLGPLQRFLTYLIAVTPLLFLPSCTVDSKPVSRPNVVFIMADDMGWGDVQAYNPESLIATPNIDRLSQEGLTFMDAHSGAAVCSPTRYGVMTGRFFWRTYKGHSLVMPYDPPTIPPERMTWGSLMQKQGYETGYIGKWHLGLWYPSKPQQGFARQYTMNEMQVDFSKPVLGGPTDLGFDYFFGNAGGPNNDSPFAFIENDRWVEEPTVMTPPEMAAQPGVVEGLMVPDWDQEKVDTHLTERAVSFISNHVAKAPDQPFFLYYSLSAPHIPFTPPDFIKGASQAGPRGDMNALVDWVVGEIRDELEKEGVLDNTILIFTSDNGPRRGENGHMSAGPFRGYKNTVYEGGHKVPFVVRWPGRVEAGARSDVPISLTDMMATFADYFDYALPEDAAEDSYSVLSALLGPKESIEERPALIADNSFGDFSIRSGPWKLLILNPNDRNGLKDITLELYNLDTDPYETANQAGEHPDIVNHLTQLLADTKESGLRFVNH